MRHFYKNPLFAVTSLNSAGVLVKIIAGFISSKVLAYVVGPQGMALVGNMQNFITAAHNIATAGLYEGIVTYVARHREDAEQLKKLLASVLSVITAATVGTSVVLIGGAGYWSQLIFETAAYRYVFIILGLSLPLYAFNMFYLAVLNGYGRYRTYIFINMAGYGLTLFLIVFLVWQYEIDGALTAMVAIPALLMGVTLLFAPPGKILRISFKNSSGRFRKGLLHYAIMTLVSSLAIPAVYILIRNYIRNTIGIAEAGYWEAMNRISAYYLMFVSSLMTLYILPKMAGFSSYMNFRATIKEFYKTVLPLFILGLTGVYLLRYEIIRLILTEEFLPTARLFLWQHVGDVFKVAAMVIAYRFYVRKLVLPFVISELISVGLFYGLSLYFLERYGLEGVVMAYACNYLLYFLLILFIFRKPLFGRIEGNAG